MLFGLLLALVLVLSPVVALGLIVWQHRRLSELQARVRALEGGERGLAASAGQEVSAAPRREQAEVLLADLARPATADAEPVDWEQLIGRRALGWVAVCLLLGAVAFFLRFAYDNLWIGPQGQVGIGILAGLALVLAGWRYHRWQWFRFSQMLSAAGIVALYLSIYSSYAFYHLLPQQIASVCMLVVILQAAVVAVLYAAPILAWTSMLGGFFTPVLMGSEVDRYPEFFSYLVALNLGVLVISRVRRWSGLGTAALLATHGLFWLWYERWYHPEKLTGALLFHLALFGVFLSLDLSRGWLSARRATVEDLGRLLLNACLWFAAAHFLLRPDYGDWLGLLALAMAALYIGVARSALRARPPDEHQLLTGLAASVGFIAWAIPLQAQARWVALGWAAVAWALAWFGLRIRTPALRAMAAALMTLAAGRLLVVDILSRDWRPVFPVFNPDALPALGVIACLLAAVACAARYRDRLGTSERTAVGIAAVASLLLLWFVLTVDVDGWFRFQARTYTDQSRMWRWLGQLAISALWAGYATVLLALGFARRWAIFRWTALLVFAATTAKVVLVDMAGLDEFYRILAFFVVALLLGWAAWAYQRIRIEAPPGESGTAQGEPVH